MADFTPLDKLQPCLLDRLTDDEPEKNQESRNKRVVNLTRYREAVLRDLSWLLNTHADAEQSGLAEFDDIVSSVLNFGVQNVAGKTASSLSIDDMRYRLLEAIRRFEPRILPDSLSIGITIDPHTMSNRRSLSFEIRGILWIHSIPESLFIKTDLDLETGKTRLNWGGSG